MSHPYFQEGKHLRGENRPVWKGQNPFRLRRGKVYLVCEKKRHEIQSSEWEGRWGGKGGSGGHLLKEVTWGDDLTLIFSLPEDRQSWGHETREV